MATSPSTTPAVAAGPRLVFAIAVGLACAGYVVAHGLANPDFMSDFDQVWGGAHALLAGKDPYQVVGPGREFYWKWPLYYPLPALILATPLTLMPLLAARAVFAGATALLLAWAVTRDGWFRLPIFISVSFFVNVELAQWSALLAAAYFIPGLAAIGAAKPNFGLVLALGARSMRTPMALAFGAVVLLGVSYLMLPGWHQAWLANLESAPHFRAPFLRPFGFLLLLAVLRWRRPEARWLLGLSLVPQAPSFYDPLLLGVICGTTRESLAFAISTVVLFFYVGFNVPQPTYLAWGELVGNATVWFCYLPALVIVLLRRGDDGLTSFVRAVVQRAFPKGRTA